MKKMLFLIITIVSVLIYNNNIYGMKWAYHEREEAWVLDHYSPANTVTLPGGGLYNCDFISLNPLAMRYNCYNNGYAKHIFTLPDHLYDESKISQLSVGIRGYQERSSYFGNIQTCIWRWDQFTSKFCSSSIGNSMNHYFTDYISSNIEDYFNNGNAIIGFSASQLYNGDIIYEHLTLKIKTHYPEFPIPSLSINNVGNNRYSVNWSVPNNVFAQEYRLLRTKPGDIHSEDIYNGTNTSYIDGPLTPGTYQYRIVAFYSNNEFNYRDASITVPPLSPPSGVTATSGAPGGGIYVQWNAVEGATYYRAFRNETNNSSTAQAVGTWRYSLAYPDEDTIPGKTYYYWIKAATSASGDNASGFSSVATGWSLLDPPNGVQASKGTYTDRIRVQWNSVNGASHYHVYRNTGPNSAGAVPIGSWQTSTTYNDFNAIPGQVYYYFVKAAISSSGERSTDYSSQEASGWRASEPAPNNPPNTPTLSSPANGATNISLTPTLQASAYSDPDGDSHANSRWQVANNSNFSSPEWDSGDSYQDSTSVTVPSGRLSNGTTYYWRVRYKDSRGAWSNWSNSRSFTTVAAPNNLPSVTTNAASNITQNSARLNASVNPRGSATEVSFYYWLATSSPDPDMMTLWDNIGSGTSSISVSADISGLECGTPYKFMPIASNDGGVAFGDEKPFTTSVCPVDQVQPPTFNPDSGSYPGSSVSVTVSCATPGATIHYTTNGSEPTQSSPTVASDGTVNVPVPGTLRAKAFKSDMDPSETKTASYSSAGQVETPTFNPDGGSHPGSSVSVTVSCATAGAIIRYASGSGTSFGADPTTTSTVVPANGIVNVPVPGWLKAKAWKEGMTESGVKPAVYTSESTQTFYPFPDTGQTRCYNNTTEIACPSPGQVFYGQDTQHQPRLPRSYTKLGHGDTVLPDNAQHVDDGGPWMMTKDNITGLIWEVKTNDNKDEVFNWDEAVAYTEGLSIGGHEDWRLPDIKELSSLVNAAGSPLIDASWFPRNVSSNYWSSTPLANTARLVDFDIGVVFIANKSDSNYVRAVRGGPPPQQSLLDHGDGTVTDTTTGLMWQKCSYGQTWTSGQCMGSATSRTWKQALEAAENLTWPPNGYSDWRLPNRNELQSLVDYSRSDPAIDPKMSSESSVYWSSTTDADLTWSAWRVGFRDGIVYYYGDKSETWYVRAVRAGHSDIGAFPSVTTNPASNIGQNSARLNATVNPNGSATTAWFEYGPTTSYGSTTSTINAGSGTSNTSVNRDLSDLDCGTEYNFRTVAQNAGGITNGSNRTFTTSACPVPPTVTTNPASNIGQNSARLNATVNPNGSATTAWFEYGPTTSYGSTTSTINAGSGTSNTSVNRDLSDLDCGTEYNFRTVAQNAGGITNGSNRTFTTSACPSCSLADALDTTNLTWITGGHGNWYCQTSVSHYGGNAAQSGSITHNQESWLQATVTGPGTLRFQWRVSSEANWDFLSFFIGNSLQDRISGEVNWQERTFSIPAGTHTLRWVYSKDGSVSLGADAGWVDYVRWEDTTPVDTPDTYTVTPLVGTGGTINPEDAQTVNHGATTTFTVTPDTGYTASVGGTCDGKLEGDTYTTDTITTDCTVEASFTLNTYTVTPSAGDNGSITPDEAQTVNHGETATFTATPDTGYTASVGGTCDGTLDGDTFITDPITTDCTVEASFTLNTYTVTPSAGDNGSISPSTPQTLNHGQTATYTVTPNTGYTASVGGTCGGTLDRDTFTTDPISEDCTVEASFSLNSHTVTPSAGDNGSITPYDAQTVDHGDTAIFTVTPDTGYTASVGGTCDGTLDGDTFTTDPITEDCTVEVSFTEQPGYFGSLTVDSTGALNVPITANSPEYNGTSTYNTANIPIGTEITLTAPAIADSTFFSSWSGCDSTSHADRACTVSVKDDTTVTANYFTDLRKMLEYDESYYLAAYDDIRDAVDRGLLPSGFEHYIHSGRFENRRPNALFDPHFYMARYPDIGQAIAGGMYPGTAFDHFVASGLWEGRIPSAVFESFDARTYLAANPDLARHIPAHIGSAFYHYVMFGFGEGRDVGGPFFDESYYLARYQDIRDTIASVEDFGTAYDHFMTSGLHEGRIPSATFAGFDPEAYLAANPDLRGHVGGSLGSELRHYLLWGIYEGRSSGAGASQRAATASPQRSAASSFQTPGNIVAPSMDEPCPLGMDDGRWLTSLYLAFLGQAADQASLDAWLDQIALEHLTLPEIAEIIATSEPVREVLGLHSYQNWDEAWTPTAGETQRTFVQAVYRNLFNREPEAAQMDLFLDLILTQSVTPGRIGGEIIRDAMQENAVDWITLWNKIQVAEHLTRPTPAWSADGLIIIRQILAGVTEDPATVETALERIDILLQ